MRRLPFPMAITTAFEMLQGKMSLKDYGSESRLFSSMLSLFCVATFFSGEIWLERLDFTFLVFNCLLQFFCTENSRCLIRKGSSKAAKTWAFLYSLFTCSTGARLSRAKETAASHLYWKKSPPPFSVGNPWMWMLMWMLMAYRYINGIYAMVMVVTKTLVICCRKGIILPT